MANKKEKKVVILFSSGLDSTYLMYKNLQEGNQVSPVYVEVKNNENKSAVEKQNVKMLTKLFQKNYPDKVENPSFVSEIFIRGRGELILQQVPLWILGMLYAPIYETDEIHIGYVANDDAISFLSEIRKIYRSYGSIVHGGKMPKLQFPLIKSWKSEMVKELPDEYKPYMSSCENPHLKPFFIKLDEDRVQLYEPCGECTPCQRIVRDRIAYNRHYQKMVDQDCQARSLGWRFTHVKNDHREVFEKFEANLYNEISPAIATESNTKSD